MFVGKKWISPCMHAGIQGEIHSQCIECIFMRIIILNIIRDIKLNTYSEIFSVRPYLVLWKRNMTFTWRTSKHRMLQYFEYYWNTNVHVNAAMSCYTWCVVCAHYAYTTGNKCVCLCVQPPLFTWRLALLCISRGAHWFRGDGGILGLLGLLLLRWATTLGLATAGGSITLPGMLWHSVCHDLLRGGKNRGGNKGHGH